MSAFPSPREAKAFAVECVVEQAAIAGVALSDTERQTLVFSIEEKLDPEVEAEDDDFDLNYDREAYEKRITRLISDLQKRLRSEDREKYERWKHALQTLRAGDHYLLVMANAAVSHSSRSRWLWMLLLALPAGLVLAFAIDQLLIRR